MRHARDFTVTVLVLGLLGVVAGVLWSLLAPRPPYVMTKQGPLLADPSTQTLIAADGWFAVVTGVLGLACGAVGYTLSRRGRPLAVVLGLAAGGLLGAYLTLEVGRAVNLGTQSVTAAGTAVTLIPGPLGLTAQGVMCAWPLLAVGLFFALEGVAGYRDSPLRRPFGGQDPYGPLSTYDISGR
ncbi:MULTISPECIES: hypothetical protein [Streptosporangium]|uniref:Membrane associated rhomboid family serine protease n=1 Tax=Streptosporangium brasiliense TaxID=47480 RepID=A0ABT9R078_9ACTN|nr:hypothetical protein [Streptosporangium brasiliense]MDP9861890.1 membrane associated rhomboid family serine protease [Streptosporangium brasiliense]